MVEKRVAQRTPMHYRKESLFPVGEYAGAPTKRATPRILEKSPTIRRSNAYESRCVVPGVRLHYRGIAVGYLVNLYLGLALFARKEARRAFGFYA